MNRNEKVFELYLYLPSEMRRVIIDEMHPMDRCRFTRCSKLSQKEARESKNFIYGLRFEASQRDILFEVTFDKRELEGFQIKFEREDGKNWMVCLNLLDDELWVERLGNSTNLMKFAAEQFTQFLRLYQHKIKYLRFEGLFLESQLKNYDFRINNLDNLQELELTRDMDTRQFLSKIRRPLKHLSISNNSEPLSYFQEIYEVQDSLNLHNTRLTNEQFHQLSAFCVIIHIGALTENDIASFVLSWQRGTLGKEVRRYEWRIPKSLDFDKEKVFRLLGVRLDQHGVDICNIDVHINHSTNLGKTAKLKYVKEITTVDYEHMELAINNVRRYCRLVFEVRG